MKRRDGIAGVVGTRTSSAITARIADPKNPIPTQDGIVQTAAEKTFQHSSVLTVAEKKAIEANGRLIHAAFHF